MGKMNEGPARLTCVDDVIAREGSDDVTDIELPYSGA